MAAFENETILRKSDLNKLSEYAHSKCILFFWASWHTPSQPGGQMDEVYNHLKKNYGTLIQFLKVEAENSSEISFHFNVQSVPTFIALVGGNEYGRVEGVNAPEVAKLAASLSAAVAPALKIPLQSDNPLNIDTELSEKLNSLINSAPVMLFMKGSADAPKCKFSRKITDILKDQGVGFASFDILTDESVRQALKIHSNWPTYPQLYAKGVLIGGVDIVEQLSLEGSLLAELGVSQLEEPPQQTTQIPEDEAVTLENRLKSLTHQSQVMLFMKGTPENPKCGFSRTIVQILRDSNIIFDFFDILTDENIRQGLKTYSNWPTYPQLYVKGDLVGGVDIVKELQSAGNLAEQLGLEIQPAGSTLEDRLKSLIGQSRVMLFMRGSPEEPKCGFSSKIVKILQDEGIAFDTFDILEDNELRQGLKAFSNWPTYPQLYVNNELIGGVDIVQEMQASNELASLKG